MRHVQLQSTDDTDVHALVIKLFSMRQTDDVSPAVSLQTNISWVGFTSAPPYTCKPWPRRTKGSLLLSGMRQRDEWRTRICPSIHYSPVQWGFMLSAHFISVMEGGRVRLGIYRLHRVPFSQDSQSAVAWFLLCLLQWTDSTVHSGFGTVLMEETLF